MRHQVVDDFEYYPLDFIGELMDKLISLPGFTLRSLYTNDSLDLFASIKLFSSCIPTHNTFLATPVVAEPVVKSSKSWHLQGVVLASPQLSLRCFHILQF